MTSRVAWLDHDDKQRKVMLEIVDLFRERDTVDDLEYGPLVADAPAPWDVAFDLAKQGRSVEASDLVPYWVYPIEGGASIERHAFTLPLSRDVERLRDLQMAVATYRLAFGQPRQVELIAFLEH